MKKTFWLLGIIWILACNLDAQESLKTLMLPQLIDSALQNNHLLKANEKTNLIKLTEIEWLQTNYQPRVSASANFSYWKFLMPNKQKLLGDGFTDMYTDVSAYQKLYDWGENNAKKSVVEEEIALNNMVRRQIHNTIVWGVSDVYLETQKASTEIESHKNALQQLSEHLKYAENLYAIGKVSGVDVLKINVQISMEQKNLQKAINAHAFQLAKLKRLCYIDGNEPLDMGNNIDTLYVRCNLSLSADSIYKAMLQNNPAMLMAEQRMVIEKKQSDLTSFQNRPELYSFGVASWEHGYIPFGDNFNYNLGVGLRYTIPYWGGSGYKSRVKQSMIRVEQMRDEKNQTFQDIQKEIDMQMITINDIKSEIVANKRIIALAIETLHNAAVRYQSGQGTIIDVLDAQSILTETSIAFNKSSINYLQALARLNYLSGNNNYPFNPSNQ